MEVISVLFSLCFFVFVCLFVCFFFLRTSMVLPRNFMVSAVIRMKVVVVLRRSSMLPRSCSCGVAPWRHCCVLASLKRGQNCRT